MKSISESLLLEQKKPTRQPALEAVVRTCAHPGQYGSEAYHFGFFGWEKLWEGSTPAPSHHGVAIPQDGSLNRILIDNSCNVYHQRVTSPGPLSNFAAAWNFVAGSSLSNRNGAIAAGLASQNMYLFFMGANLMYRKSTDGGATWGTPDNVSLTAWSQVNFIAACMSAADYGAILFYYAPVGAGPYLMIIKGSSAGWTSPASVTYTETLVTAAMYYDGDYNIVAQTASGKLVRIVYGDGYRQAAGTWSDVVSPGLTSAAAETTEIVTQYQVTQSYAPDYSSMGNLNESMATGQQVIKYNQPSRQSKYSRTSRSTPVTNDFPWGNSFQPLGWTSVATISEVQATDNLDTGYPFLCKPPGQPAIMSFTKPGQRWYYRLKPATDFYDGKWARAHKQLLDTPYGMALACDSTYIWATRTNEVWRCVYPGVMPNPPFVEGTSPHSTPIGQPQILNVKETIRTLARSELTLEVDNSNGAFAGLPGSIIKRGSTVELHYGYVTDGDEMTGGNTYFLEDWLYSHSKANRSSVVLHCIDAWGLLEKFAMPCPVEINLLTDTYTVYGLIEFLVGLIGVTLSYKSRSTAITSVYPRFIIRAGQSAASVVRQLLKYVPDTIFFSGLGAYIVYPQSTDSSVYDYYFPFNAVATPQPLHYLHEGQYRLQGKDLNHVIVIGKDDNEEAVVGDQKDLTDISLVGERLDYLYLPPLGSTADAGYAAAAALGRKE